MLAGIGELAQAYLAVLNPTSIMYGLGGALTGILVGCLPGLSATLCIALLTTLTVKLPANDAILILVCSYVGTLYGGSRSAILLNIPGTAANAASCADGHALALRGEAGRAIGIATSGAFTGVLFGVFCLAALTPVSTAASPFEQAARTASWRCPSAPTSSSGWHCSASPCPAASSATTR